MAKYEHLPIYKQAMELTVFIETVVRGFPRYHKYALGTRLREKSWEIIGLIVKANNTPVKQRRPLLLNLRDGIEELNVALTVAREVKAFQNFNSYRHAARMGVDLSRQSEGWLKGAAAASSPESYPASKGTGP